MYWNEQKVLANIQRSSTDDLLDRMTAYRHGMEAEAITMIERELHARGITAAQIQKHQEACQRECILLPDGTAVMCSYCRKPAVQQCWGWHKLWNKVPLFPRTFYVCKNHGE